MKHTLAMLCISLAMSACSDIKVNVSDETGTEVIRHSGGDLLRATGAMKTTPGPVKILGECYSACTTALGRDDTCVAPDARLMFHGVQGGYRKETPFWDHLNSIVANMYPEDVKKWYYSLDLTKDTYVTGQWMADNFESVKLCKPDSA